MLDLEDRLDELNQLGLHQRMRMVSGPQGPHVVLEGRPVLLLCSGNALGLADHPLVRQAAADAAMRWGVGAGAARVSCGTMTLHRRLEERLANFTGQRSALLFGSGVLANLGVIPALARRGEIVLHDELSHCSIVDGCRLSGADVMPYRHGDPDHLAWALRQCDGRATLIATDGMFGMDGDVAPLRELALVARVQGAMLYVDDAHGVGVLGPEGRGTVAAARLGPDAAPLQLVTLGKALGSYGAAVVGDGDFIQHLSETARSYIYTTALPPGQAAASLAAVKLARRETWRREKLIAAIARFREGAAQRGFELMPSHTAIQPMPCANEADALAFAKALEMQGYWVSAIRPPTVADGKSRLRITLTALHTPVEIDGLLDALSFARDAIGQGFGADTAALAQA